MWYTNWVWDQLSKKQHLRSRLEGVWARETSEKNWDPLRIFATIKASNFKFGTQLGFGTSLPKTTFCTKIDRGLGQGSLQKKIWDPLLISATVEVSNFKFVMQLGFWTSLPKNNVQEQNWRGHGPWEHPEKFGTPYLFLQPVKKIGTQQVYLAKHKFQDQIRQGLNQESTTPLPIMMMMQLCILRAIKN